MLKRTSNFLFSHYQALNLTPAATQEEIKERYLHLAKKHHPDTSQFHSEDFVRIKQAYDILKNPQLRKNYDAEISRPKYYYYYAENDTDNVDQDSKPHKVKEIALFFFQLCCSATIAYMLYSHFNHNLTDHELRRQNIILANQNIDSSPTTQEKRRKQYAKEMKQKKFSCRVVEMKVSDGSKQTTKRKNSRQNSLQSIKGIRKDVEQTVQTANQIQYM